MTNTTPAQAGHHDDIKAAYVATHGSDDGWLDIQGSYFISGWQASRASVVGAAVVAPEGWKLVPLEPTLAEIADGIRAIPAPTALTPVVDDLRTLVARLANSLRKAAPDNDLPDKALDYLQRKGLAPSALRSPAGTGAQSPQPPAAQDAEVTEPVAEWEKSPHGSYLNLVFRPGYSACLGDKLYLRPPRAQDEDKPNYKFAFDEWHEKTEWLQNSALPVKYLGWHRADVLRDMIEQNQLDAERYRGLRELAKEQLLHPSRAFSEFAPDMRTHWVLPTLMCSGPIGGYADFDEAVQIAIDAAKAREKGAS